MTYDQPKQPPVFSIHCAFRVSSAHHSSLRLLVSDKMSKSPGEYDADTLYDVCVLGVGAMGSGATYALAARGYKVLALEQFEIAHNKGNSHGDSRIIRLAYFEGSTYEHKPVTIAQFCHYRLIMFCWGKCVDSRLWLNAQWICGMILKLKPV